MAKIRVYELARDLGVESKVLTQTAKNLGIIVQSHQSTLEDDHVELIRKTLAGETTVKEAMKKVVAKDAAASPAGAAKTVIRRRRPGDAVEAPAPVEAASEPETSVAVDSSVTSEKVEEDQATPKVVVKQAEEVQGHVVTPKDPVRAGMATVQDTTTPKAVPPVSSSGVTRAIVAPTVSPSPATGVRGEASDSESNSTRKRTLEAGGAKIVRKASKEESDAIRAESTRGGENSAAGAATRRGDRREDSRGTKYTGIGSSQNIKDRKVGPGGGPEVDGPPSEAAGWQTRRVPTKTEREREKEKLEEEALAAKKAAALTKSKRANFNLRDVLSELEGSGEDAANEMVLTPYGMLPKLKPVGTVAQKKRELKRRKDLKKTEITVSKASSRVIKLEASEITIGELSREMNVKAGEVLKKLMAQGMMATINQTIDIDTATLIATDFGYEVVSSKKEIKDILGTASEHAESEGTETRAPIVTVMGHVDHGKTSILDALRQSNVASGEAGGITQHIGAYWIEKNGKKIAFLDTPGHEAFSAMRARGANITDLVVLVVAADDGVMPQTIEAISHAKDAGVPIVVAVNKMDKPNVNVERIYAELAEHGVQSEDWGGDVQFVKVSAHTKMGLDELVQAILLQAEVLELRTISDMPADGVVVEAHLDPGRGPVANVMVRHGTLQVGDLVVAGVMSGRVRAMFDHNGKQVDIAGPSTPVQILGLGGVPDAGDHFASVESEKVVRDVVSWRETSRMQTSFATAAGAAQSLESLLAKMREAETPELPVIIKGDTQGSVEAVCESITKLNSERVRNKIIHRGVGGIGEGDLALAAAGGAVVIGFNVRAGRGLDDQAKKMGVVVDYYSIIYELVDAIKSLMAGKLPPIREQVIIGHAQVRQPIQIPKFGTIAGSSVIDGRITRSSMLRLVRDDIVIYEGKIGSLRRFKDDVKEVKNGFECGISFENYHDIKEGDVIEAYEIKETVATL